MNRKINRNGSGKTEKMRKFDPNAPGIVGEGIFGLPFTAEEADLIILPVPWGATVSYGEGTENAPGAILKASLQVDLYEAAFPEGWRQGIAMLPVSKKIRSRSDDVRRWVHECIAHIEQGGNIHYEVMQPFWNHVNNVGRTLTEWVKTESMRWLGKGKMVGIVGGDHSVPLGLMKALAEMHLEYDILHFLTEK